MEHLEPPDQTMEIYLPPNQVALFEAIEVLEGMTPLQLRAEKVRILSEISEREALVRSINDVLKGYGE